MVILKTLLNTKIKYAMLRNYYYIHLTAFFPWKSG